ncbi:MAG: hypothetical protein ACLS3C_00680 [Oscillospiraceae bacterium]
MNRDTISGSVVHAKGETLEDFDGPLDVILLLLSKNKIEIQDIQISRHFRAVSGLSGRK